MHVHRANWRSVGKGAETGSLDGRCTDPNAVINAAARFGLTRVTGASISQARAFAAHRLGPCLASVKTFEQVQAISQAALFAAHDEKGELAGVFAGFSLDATGAELCATCCFDASNFDVQHVCSPGQAPYAWYGWGFVASSKLAAWAVVSAARAIQSELFWGAPAYARAVTPDGARITRKIGYRALTVRDPSLVWIPPRAREAAMPVQS